MVTSKPKVLVIDEETSLEPLYRKALTGAGYEPAFASNGRDGLQKLREDRPDVVVMDLCLPDVNGMSVLGLIAERREAPAVVVHTRHPCCLDFAAWVADAHVPKSSDLSALVSSLDRLAAIQHDSATRVPTRVAE